VELPGLAAGQKRDSQNPIFQQIQLVERNKGSLQPSANGQLVNC
jgi:hypothetical protein